MRTTITYLNKLLAILTNLLYSWSHGEVLCLFLIIPSPPIHNSPPVTEVVSGKYRMLGWLIGDRPASKDRIRYQYYCTWVTWVLHTHSEDGILLHFPHQVNKLAKLPKIHTQKLLNAVIVSYRSLNRLSLLYWSASALENVGVMRNTSFFGSCKGC